MSAFRKTLRKLFGDKRGNTIIIMAAAMVPLIGAVGLAIDATRAFIVKDRLQKSIDAAGLAAGRALTDADRLADAQDYLALNFTLEEDLGKMVNFSLAFDEGTQEITINATAKTNATFMRIFGFDTMDVAATTVIQRELKGAEVMLVLDTTGSMASSGKMTALKDASHDLLDIVFGDDQTVDDFYMGIVPYIAAVNVGDDKAVWLRNDSTYYDTPDPYATEAWRGCLEARPPNKDRNQAPPTNQARKFESYWYPPGSDNNWGSPYGTMKGPNGGCPPEIAQLGSTKNQLKAKIDELTPTPRGGTIIPQGMVWGWRSLSPNYQNMWGGVTPAELPLGYTEPLMEKVLIIMTDGQNQIGAGCGSCGGEYTAYGRIADFGFNNMTDARLELNAITTNICNRVKNNGITLYTITFGGSLSTEIQDLMEGCASQPEFFFHAPDNATLAQVFKIIGGQLSNLRISR